MNTVERMARGIARHNYPSASDADIDEMWEGWTGDALAALAAMREPSEGMVEAGRNWDGPMSLLTKQASGSFTAMIDQAIQEAGQ